MDEVKITKTVYGIKRHGKFIYVGETMHPKDRHKKHQERFGNCDFIPLAVVPFRRALEVERFWINNLTALGYKLKNIKCYGEIASPLPFPKGSMNYRYDFNRIRERMKEIRMDYVSFAKSITTKKLPITSDYVTQVLSGRYWGANTIRAQKVIEGLGVLGVLVEK